MSLLDTILPVVGYASCIALCYFIIVFGYRLYCHPLKKYPGPLLARLSDSYAGYYALKTSLHHATFEDHQRHGDVMRYGPDRLIFNTSAALRDIYQNPRVTKSDLYLFALINGVPFIFNLLDRDAHYQRRKIISPFLAERSVSKFEPTIVRQTDILLKQLLGSSSHPVDLTASCSQFATDVAANLGFGYHLELQTKEENRFVRTGLEIGNYRVHTFMNFPFLSQLRLNYLFERNSIRQKWGNLLVKMMKTRLTQEKGTRHDYYSYVMNSIALKPDDPQHSEIFAESMMFMSAGGDTVSTAMTALFFYLSRNRHCYDKLTREIRTTFESGSEIQRGPQLSGCSYLRACIDEALRMSPPIGGTLWRQLAKGEDDKPFVVDGHIIPEGTHVGVNVYSIYHNEKYFPEPFAFKPERWIANDKSTANNPDEQSKLLASNKAFTPFTLGIRSCPGKAMAYFEASLVVAKTLWYFDFEKSPGILGDVGRGKSGCYIDEFQLQDMLTSRHDGPYLTFRPRGDFWK
ncbi:cytochrome P450 [Hypoxylon trugodes]|uniref:cytochrome P450 n=1 Tax=Hypoxylon trugodes TaxID=326681 RepID=UPI002195F139|nr:cytochrome P450 [Hypoxylon trugodes]KAI1389601.1 cytochrome P450 [Hypoxylon trugodes]